MLCWFAGTSSRGLPFIHDSFRPGPRPICHRPRPPSNPDDELGADKAERDWQRTLQSHDKPRDFCDSRDVSSHIQLPALECRDMMIQTERNLASRGSYTRRFKACYRLKGIDPNKAHRADRRRVMTSTDALLDVRKRLVQSIFPNLGKVSAIDSPILSTIQESKSGLHLKSETSAPSSFGSSWGETLNSKQGLIETETRGQVVDEVDLVRQLEEKLRRSSDHGYETKSSAGGPLLSERSRRVCRKGHQNVATKSGLRHRNVVREDNEDRAPSDARAELSGSVRRLSRSGPRGDFSCGTRRLLGGVLSQRKMEQLLKDANPDLSRASRETVA